MKRHFCFWMCYFIFNDQQYIDNTISYSNKTPEANYSADQNVERRHTRYALHTQQIILKN